MNRMHPPYGSFGRSGRFGATGAPDLHGVRWRFQPGGELKAAPVGAHGLVYIVEEGGDMGRLHAIDASSGVSRWQHTLKDRRNGPAAPAEDLVFVGTDDGLAACAPATGSVVWEHDASGAPAAVGRTLLLSSTRGVVAVDLNGRVERWSTAESPGGCMEVPLSVYEDLVVAPLGFEGNHTHGGLVAYHLNSGELAWQVEDDYVACDLDVEDEGDRCDEDWRHLVPFHPVVIGDTILALRQRDHDDTGALDEPPESWDLVRFDVRTGAERSSLALSDDLLSAAPAVGEALYLPIGGEVRAVSPDTGATIWSCQLDGGVTGTPALAGETLYVATGQGSLAALDTGSGNVRWRFDSGEPIGSWWKEEEYWYFDYREWEGAIAVADGVVYLRTDASVYALH